MRKILDKWLYLKANVPPGNTPEEIEQARRLFYAGATAGFEALIVETRSKDVAAQVADIEAVEEELRQHRNELAELYRSKIN